MPGSANVLNQQIRLRLCKTQSIDPATGLRFGRTGRSPQVERKSSAELPSDFKVIPLISRIESEFSIDHPVPMWRRKHLRIHGCDGRPDTLSHQGFAYGNVIGQSFGNAGLAVDHPEFE